MVIPIHDENPLRRRPVVTWSLIAINVAVFLTEPAVAHFGLHATQTVAQACRQAAYFDHHAAIPYELIHHHPLPPHHYTEVTARGVHVQCPTINEAGKRPWFSVLESMFLHGGWLHLLGNMLFLLIFGNNVEDRMGRGAYLAFYLATGYVAAYGFALSNSSSTVPIIGASGAIAGVLGAYIVVFPRARVISLLPFLFFIPVRLPAWFVLGLWFVLQAIYSAALSASGANVAYAAHIYGFAFGVLIALLFRRYLTTVRTSDPWHRVHYTANV